MKGYFKPRLPCIRKTQSQILKWDICRHQNFMMNSQPSDCS